MINGRIQRSEYATDGFRMIRAMSQEGGAEEAHQIALEAYGVRAVVGADSEELLEHLQPVLPPGWTPTEPHEDDRRFALLAEDGAFYTVEADTAAPMVASAELDVAVGVLDAALRAHIALRAPDVTFVHAGAVAQDGRAIVLPGPAFSGKSALVAELVRAGATYYSDEYAVLDDQGLVHPYSRRLSIRDEEHEVTRQDVAS